MLLRNIVILEKIVRTYSVFVRMCVFVYITVLFILKLLDFTKCEDIGALYICTPQS
jgi:hypothetical protein